MQSKDQFTFELSLSVLNHLGRNLYRGFATVLGEAISNSWDADANNVRIYVDRAKQSFVIKDDGDGMTADDFQNKFLRIGYSKRKGGETTSPKGRPYIGRKGIGKLALLSCANTIALISKVKGGNYVGGVIDNSGLDKAITDDLTPQEYPLGKWNPSTFQKYVRGHHKGTIIYFDGVKEGIKNSLEFLKKIVALYFRFSLLDKSFNIFIDDEKITYRHLDDLAEKTQFLWTINDYDDPYITGIKKRFTIERNEKKQLKLGKQYHGFIASVERPRDLKIMTTDERVGVDLFVNGRLRERDILQHIPTARVAENYLYGQIHFDSLDDDVDRFTSSRENIVANDPKFADLLKELRKKIIEIATDWDKWRLKHGDEGDPENERLTKKERASVGLYNAVSKEFDLPASSKMHKKVDTWVDDLTDDAAFNFQSYAECFISENLIRKYIQERKMPLSPEATLEVKKWKKVERDAKNLGNVSIDIRKIKNDLSYLSMDDLANLVDKPKDQIKEAGLARDAKVYRPIRDAIAHTARLTDTAKNKLTTVYQNIKARMIILLSKK